MQLTLPTLESEQVKYNDVWRDRTYRVKCHGLDLWQTQRSLFPPDVESAIDLGHGTGRLVMQWDREGIDAWGVDLAKNAADPEIAKELGNHLMIAPLWDFETLYRFNIGVCADVLEHIPEHRLDQVLENIAKATDLAYLKIACFDHVHLGHTLHMTVHPPIWWIERINAMGGTLAVASTSPKGCLLIWSTQ